MLGLGSSSILGIGLRVYLVNQFSNQASSIITSMGGMSSAADKLSAKFTEMAVSGASMVAAGWRINRAWGSIFDSGMKFQHTMTIVKAVSEATSEQMVGLSAAAKSLSREFPYMANEIADGMERIAKGGIKADAIPSLTAAFLAAATASREQFGSDTGVAEMMTDLMSANNLSAKQAASLGNMMTTAALESTISFRQLYEAFTYSQDVFKNLNIPLEQSLALMSLLANQGVKASRQGIALSNMYQELSIAIGGADRGNKKGKAFARLGIDPQDLVDAQGNMLGTLKLFSKMKEGIRDMGSIDKQNIFYDIFGRRGGRGASPIIDNLLGKPGSVTQSLSELTSKIANANASGGSMAKLIEQYRTTPEFQKMLLNNAWEELKITLYEGIPLVIEALKIVKQLVYYAIQFAKTPIGKTVALLTMLAGPLLVIAGTFRVMTAGMGLLMLRGNMMSFGTAARWAWSTAALHASRYLGLLRGSRGVMSLIGRSFAMNSAGSLYNPANGRIIMTAHTLENMNPLAKLIFRFLPGLTRTSSVLGAMGKMLGPITMVSSFFSFIGVTLKTQLAVALKSLVYVVFTVANALMGLIEVLSFGTVNFGGGGFSGRQEKLGERLFGKKSWDPSRNDPVLPGQGSFSPTDQKNYDNRMRFINRHKGNETAQVVVNIIQDGKKVLTKHINTNDEHTINAQYGIT